MKKFSILFTLVLCLLTQSVQASVCYENYCPKQPYDLASNTSRNIQKYCGMNFLTEKIAQAIIKREVKKSAKLNLKTKLTSYSVTDLKNGKFKSLRLYGKNLNVDGIYVTKLDINTVCDYNSVELTNKSLRFRENMIMKYSLEISNKDIQKTIKSSEYIKMLNKINFTSYGITFLKFEGANVEIKNEKLYFTIKVTTPMSSTPMNIVVSASIKVEDGQIVLSKIHLVNAFAIVDFSKYSSLLNILNPLTFSTNILDNKDSKVSTQNVYIKGDTIFTDGYVFIPKNTVKKEK